MLKVSLPNCSKKEANASCPNWVFSKLVRSFMAFPLTKYIQIKDNYCIAYLGSNQNILDELVQQREKLENLYPGLRIYICFQDGLKHSVNQFLIPLSKLDKSKFAYIREINDTKELF